MTPWVRRLLIANIAVFFVQWTMPELAYQFRFVPALILSRPWTIVTYMFLHGGFMHILFNMMTLFFFGPRVEQRLGPSRFAQLYFVSGISGALLSFVFAPYASIIGASGAIFGVTLAFAQFWPDAQILVWGIIPVRARMMVVLTTVMSLWFGLSGMSGGIAHFAHLGGYAGGWLYLRWLKLRADRRKQQWIGANTPPPAGLLNWQKIDPRSVHEINRDEVNRILDKISASGLASLKPEEKLFLSNFVPPDDRVPPST